MSRGSLPAAPTDTGTGRIRVLIAARDRFYGDCLATSLAEAGMEPLVRAPDGLATAGDAGLLGFDVLLVETQGVAGTGWDLIDQLRRVAPLTEVVAIVDHTEIEDAVQALREAVFSILPYPVASDELVRELRRACERKRHGEARMRALDAAAGAHPKPKASSLPDAPTDDTSAAQPSPKRRGS